MSVCVCLSVRPSVRPSVCLSVCLCDRRRTQSLNQFTDLVQIRYIGSSCKYLESFFSFPPTPKIKGSSHKEKISNFSKMALTILIKFCGFYYIRSPTISHYWLFPEESLKLEKQFLIFCSSPNVAPKPTDQSRSNSISRVLLEISLAIFSFSIYTQN